MALDGTATPAVTDKDGNVVASWIAEAMKKTPYTAETTVNVVVTASDGSMKDMIPVTMKFSMIDQTYSSSGSSGGGGSSSGGGGSRVTSGTTVSGSTAVSASTLPSYVVTGKWIQNAAGKWLFTDNKRTYANEWAAVHNPYADTAKGQSAFDWFRFDQNGYMVTGWFTDAKDGNTYYLHATSDGTLGRMYTGWMWIDDNGDGIAECYYFNPMSDGTRGKLYKSTKTPDGYQVNEKGQWVVNNVVQTKLVK